MPHVILFVDDEPQVLGLLKMTFPAAAGYESLTASSGDEALRILAHREVDLLVTDQRMPGMSGIELVSRARALRPDLCVVLLTAYTDPRDIVEAINKGEVYRYLTKPWEVGDLRQTVLRALDQVHLKREKAHLDAELERRMAALALASEIARDVGVAGGHESLVERLLSRLPGIVPCDLAVALVVPRTGAASLVLQRAPGTPQATLLKLKEDALASWAESGGAPIPEGQLRVRITGDSGIACQEAMRSRLTVPLQFDGHPGGLLMLQSASDDAFGEGDARVLDLLANELAGSLRVLAVKLGGERRRLERVVECMADGLLFVDSKSEVLVANPAARRMLRAPEEEPLTTRWLKETLGFYPFDLVRGLEPGGSAPAILTEELHLFDRTLSSIISPVTDASGQVEGVAVALRDVTEQKQLDERKEEFVQLVSHELRTPLTSITGALDLVLGGLVGEVSPKQVRYLRMARDSTEKLNAIADDLLDLARLAKGKLKMEVEIVHLEEIVRAVAERYGAAAPEKGLEIAVHLPPEPTKIVADSARISQVLANLFTNAVKFTPDHGRIEVSLFHSLAIQGWVGISVWNNGEPIAESDLERIFDKFEQARTERTRRVRGTGLGLAICRSIVESHGGRIWAESGPGEGEGVRFTLVLPPQPPPEGQPVSPRPSATASRQVLVPVLVADEPESAAIARGILLRKGFACMTARPGGDLVALVKQLRPRLVLLDPRVPGLGAPALLECLRRDPDLRTVPLLVFSAPEEREAAFQAGASAFLAKPAQAEELGGAVEVLLSGVRRARHRIVVVDDDPPIRAICSEILGNHGYEVHEASTCLEAVRLVRQKRPHLILIDVQLPDGDGFSLLEGLQEERAAEPFAAVFLSARGQTADKVRGFRLGADDYLSKPFDALELVARVDAVLRRRENAIGASPITRLPSGRAIEQEVQRRLEARVPFALCYLDLDDFKAYNDHYGYAKADGLLLQVGDLLRQVASTYGGDAAFVGHIGGDDFVFITSDDRVDETCRQVVAGFDRLIPLFYEREDRERGFIEAEDRFGTHRRFPMMSVSVVAVWVPPGRFERHAEIARAAADLKKRAKAIHGSVYLKDAPGESPVGGESTEIRSA
jgi:signal transduction histidine kinase/DNA-binding response OmpR family regulator